MLPVLRPYQTDVIDRAAARVRAGLRRGVIQGETGCGKGHVAGYLAYRAYHKGSRVLVLADRRRLVNQLGGVLDAFRVPYGIVMAGRTGGTREPVILASRDTLAGWQRGEKDLPPADLVLIDEGHKSMADLYQSLLTLYPRAVVIVLTATPARNDGKSLGDFFQWLECTVPASQLIREGWLLKPEVYAPIELAKRRQKGEGKGLAGDPVSHWRAYADGLPTIAFAAKVSESLDLAARFQAAGVPAAHVDASTPDDPGYDGKSERDRTYDKLARGEIKVLSSVGLLIEGVDIPEVAAAILWSSFGSMVKYRQAAGRTMRPCPAAGKTRAVILDHAGAAGVHGLPGEDVEWSLDMGSTVAQRRQKAIEDGRQAATVYCRACGAAYAGAPACPACGKAAPRTERKRTMAEQYEATRDAILERFDAEQARDLIAEQRQRAWVRAIYTAISRNATAGMAANVFRSACKVNPWEAGVGPLPESRSDWKRPAAEVWPQFVRARA